MLTRHALLTMFAVIGIAGCRASPSPAHDSSSVAPPAPSSTPAPTAAVSPASAPASAPPAPGAASAPETAPRLLVREEKKVMVDGVVETWALVWRAPPRPSCTDKLWNTCLCGRLAYGETGQLDLVRTRPDMPDERLDISRLFADVGEMTIPRWPVLSGDPEVVDLGAIKKRPPVEVMKLGDFDHDGRATEFVLQLSSGSPCGRSPSLLVGISKEQPQLHAFGTADHPKQRLVLEHFDDWEKLRTKGSTALIQLACGDHGSETEESLEVTISPQGFRTKKRARRCPD